MSKYRELIEAYKVEVIKATMARMEADQLLAERHDKVNTIVKEKAAGWVDAVSADLQGKLNASRSTVDMMQHDKEVGEREIADLQGKLDDARLELGIRDGDCVVMQKRIDGLKDELSEAHQQLAMSHEQFTAQHAEIQQLKTKLEAQTATSETWINVVAERLADNAKLKDENNDLFAQADMLGKAQYRLDELQIEMDDMKRYAKNQGWVFLKRIPEPPL